MAEIPASFELTKRPKADGTLDLIGKDDAGSEYVARNCPTGHVTDDDLTELKVGDRTQSTARDLVSRVVDRREAFKQGQEKELDDLNHEIFLQGSGFWGCGYGSGDAHKASNGSTIARRRRFRFNDQGNLIEY